MTPLRPNDICKQIVAATDGAMGCALVDLGTGLLLALDVKPGSLLTVTALESLSAAGVTYFLDDTAGRARPDSPGAEKPKPRAALQEIQTTTEYTFNFMARVPGAERQLLVLITDCEASTLGLGWMALRQALEFVANSNESPPDAFPD